MTRTLVLLLTALPAFGHDFWIEPSNFRPARGSRVAVMLRQGEHFIGDPVPRSAERIDRFVVVDGKKERAVPGLEGRDPAGVFAVEDDGRLLVGYRTKPKTNDPMDAARFEKYLREEGMERIIELRAARGQSARPGTEIFSRSAKSLLYTGKGAGVRHDQPLGFRFEIVPLTNPYSSGAETFVSKLLFDGKPLEGALVVAMHRDDPTVRVQARSDRNGQTTLRLAKKGVWLIKTLHMVPAPPSAGVEWESIWASLTFER